MENIFQWNCMLCFTVKNIKAWKKLRFIMTVLLLWRKFYQVFLLMRLFFIFNFPSNRFFFEISDPNPAYQEFSELLVSVQKPQTNASFEKPLALQDLIQHSFDHYYVYNGSLTTVINHIAWFTIEKIIKFLFLQPPCLEVVTWLDFAEPIKISHDQVTKIKTLLSLVSSQFANW